MDDVAHDVCGGLLPRDKLTVMPDMRGGLERHARRLLAFFWVVLDLIIIATWRVPASPYRAPATIKTHVAPRHTDAD